MHTADIVDSMIYKSYSLADRIEQTPELPRPFTLYMIVVSFSDYYL
ncbi:hypothetical protein RSAG8_12846, partial [Rhizoctonia solani AG-8 WAC10335]